MATRFTKTLLVLAALSVTSFATSAHANSFNKFPAAHATQTATGFQNTAFETTRATVKTKYSTNQRIKRVVKPVPNTATRGLSYASDTGTVSRSTGFNKMKTGDLSSSRGMPVVVDDRAFTAR